MKNQTSKAKPTKRITEITHHCQSPFPRRMTNGKVNVDEVCQCGHKRSKHHDSLAYGHGNCSASGCDCDRYRWGKMLFKSTKQPAKQNAKLIESLERAGRMITGGEPVGAHAELEKAKQMKAPIKVAGLIVNAYFGIQNGKLSRALGQILNAIRLLNGEQEIPKAPAGCGYYVFQTVEDVEPALHGPYDTTKERHAKAVALRAADGDPSDGLYKLNILSNGKGGVVVTTDTFSGSECLDQEED